MKSTKATSSIKAVVDWSTGEHRSRAQLPDGRHLYMTASGPARIPSAPAVVIQHGLGGSASEWVAVQRLIARFARVYSYERAGYQHSDAPANPPTAESIAAEMKTLLTAAKIVPPYLLVGHSYGGVLIRQYLADYPDDVFGMVIVDSAPVVNKVPDDWVTLFGDDGSYEEIVGLNANRVLSDEQWETVIRESRLNEDIASQEFQTLFAGARALKNRLSGEQLLENKRLSVIFCDESNDFRKAYEYGLRHGNGTDESRETMRKYLEDASQIDEAAMREHLVLSSNARFVKAEGKQKTHNVHMVDPEFVTGEIWWVYDKQQP